MSNEKGNKAIRVTIASIGRGLLLTLPGTKTEEVAQLKVVHPDKKFQSIETLKTDWLSPFLEELNLGESNDTISGFVKLVHEGGLVRGETSLDFAPELECVRCLEQFRQPLQVESSAVFIDETMNSGDAKSHGRGKSHNLDEAETKLQAGDLESYSFKGLHLQLDEFLLDTLQTAIPDLPLCSESCKGLCSNCGANLNLETAQHNC